MRRTIILLLNGILLLLAALACVRQPSGPVIVVTATPDNPLGVHTRAPGEEDLPVSLASPTPFNPSATLILPTMDPPRVSTPVALPESYTVQAGDTLSGIAAAFGTTVATLLRLNNLEESAILHVGQVITLPSASGTFSPQFKMIPDSELVRGPATGSFDIEGYIARAGGYLSTYAELVGEVELSGSEIVRRVVDEFSVNPRLLLALLEYRAGWLLSAEPTEATLIYPMGYAQLGYEGLYKQLGWAANRLNLGYYGWRVRGMLGFEFEDGTRISYAPGLNAGTVGVQYFLSLTRSYDSWAQDVSPQGFYSTYVALFGDPFAYAVEPLLPPTLTQPPMQLPWAAGETWFYTGGPHGGYGSGSAWASIDFAPPSNAESSGCYTSPDWARAVAPGMVVRSGGGFVVLDLDMDGNETTGWTVIYLHLATEGRAPLGAVLQAGDPVGHPSCEGGVSNATHLHIGRRYNGEWIEADCFQCAPEVPLTPFVLGGWTVRGIENQEYQGYMVNGNDYRQADQGRDNPLNQVSW